MKQIKFIISRYFPIMDDPFTGRPLTQVIAIVGDESGASSPIEGEWKSENDFWNDPSTHGYMKEALDNALAKIEAMA